MPTQLTGPGAEGQQEPSHEKTRSRETGDDLQPRADVHTFLLKEQTAISHPPCLRSEPVMPDPCRSDQIRIVPERGQAQLRFLGWNKPASRADDGVNAIKKQRRAFHYAAAQHDRIRRKKIDQIGEAEAKVKSFMLDRLQRQRVALLR